MTNNTRTGLLFLILLLGMGRPLFSEEIEKPDAVDFSTVRDLIDTELGKSPGTPSIAVGVARNGKIIWEEGFGLANVEKEIKATAHTSYSLASISKPITATGLMILVEKGLVDLDRPINDYLGEAKLKAFQGDAKDATVKRLLQHVSGLPSSHHFFYEDDPYKRPAMDETIRRYGILTSTAGRVYQYSNHGYGILEYIIERVSGKSYADYIQEEVFLPLGMTNSAVYIEPGPEAKTAQRYERNGNRVPFYDFDHRGASAVYCSVHDLLQFGMFHLNNPSSPPTQILKDETLEQMKTDNEPQVPHSDYRLGWSVNDQFGHTVVSHRGGMPGVATALYMMPEEDIAVVVLTNGNTTDTHRFSQMLFAALLPDYAKKMADAKPPSHPSPKKPARATSTPERFLGTWTGEIRTHAGPVPLELIFEPAEKVQCRLLGEEHRALEPSEPIGRHFFGEDWFFGTFGIELAAKDVARFPHSLALKLKLRDETLAGDVSARASNGRYNLPFYIELKRKP